MTKATHWIVIADSSKAAIYSADARLDDLATIETLEHTASRMHGRDLTSDGPGRTQAFAGGAKSATEPKHTPHENEVHTFAHELAAHLKKGVQDRAFEGLVLVAPPEFLGHLRKEIDAPTTAMVVGSIAHDYTQQPMNKLSGLLRKQMGNKDPEHWAPGEA